MINLIEQLLLLKPTMRKLSELQENQISFKFSFEQSFIWKTFENFSNVLEQWLSLSRL